MAKEGQQMSNTVGSPSHQWFGLTRSQLLWFVAIRVIVAAVAGAVVYVVTGSVLWLIVALLLAGVVVNAASASRNRR
jgi:type IV secretory pathway VirB3-like protein